MYKPGGDHLCTSLTQASYNATKLENVHLKFSSALASNSELREVLSLSSLHESLAAVSGSSGDALGALAPSFVALSGGIKARPNLSQRRFRGGGLQKSLGSFGWGVDSGNLQ